MADTQTATTDPTDVLAGLKVIDADTHFSEPHDLWEKRAPAKYKERLPIVRKTDDGTKMWLFDGEPLFRAGGISFVNKNGRKMPYFQEDITAHGNMWDIIHEASYDAKARAEFMDDIGVHAQIVYSNILGFSMGNLIHMDDKDLAYATVSVYNDAMAEWASEAPGRLYPMAIMPFWDIELSVKEAERCKNELGYVGVCMSGEPHNAGLPDLGQPDWDPFYEAVTDLKLPLNIHVGSTPVAGKDAPRHNSAWASLPARAHKPVNSVQIELANSRFISNIVVSDVLHRWPEVKWVSVESGIGWIPYVLERVDFEYFEDFEELETPTQPSALEMFKRNVYGCFWFEKSGPTMLLEYIGADNVMWESDFPHPTCLHPDAVRRSAEALAGVKPEYVRKVMQDNAAKLYGIPI
jgi:predicted TIM-barrel fold metal-dependent hydrolase